MINKYLEKLKKEIKITKALLRSRSASNGMSYVELIVVLSIFAILSAVSMFSYREFQANVDIRNLASDIASKIVEAQKSSLDGKWNVSADPNWKPSYGVYFNTTDSDTQKQFIYFVDLVNAGDYDEPLEELDTISITKGNYISSINKCTTPPCDSDNSINSLAIIFKRPDSSAIFADLDVPGSGYVQITIISPQGKTAFIKIYPSGRIQVN